MQILLFFVLLKLAWLKNFHFYTEMTYRKINGLLKNVAIDEIYFGVGVPIGLLRWISLSYFQEHKKCNDIMYHSCCMCENDTSFMKFVL